MSKVLGKNEEVKGGVPTTAEELKKEGLKVEGVDPAAPTPVFAEPLSDDNIKDVVSDTQHEDITEGYENKIGPYTDGQAGDVNLVVTKKANAGAKLYKVAFVKDHDMQVGTEKSEYKKGDKAEVEIHIAKSLTERGIAAMIG